VIGKENSFLIMNFDIIRLSNISNVLKYSNLLNEINNLSPYYLPSFISGFSDEISSLICFYARTKDNGLILMPGHILEIPDISGYYDFVSPYGYSGPIYTSGIKEYDLIYFWEEIENWHKLNNIVSEFIRFSLNSNYVGYNGNLLLTLWNIKGVILSSEEEQWKNFERKVRKNIKRAQNENLICNIFEGSNITEKIIGEFYDVYIDTMKRNKANSVFYYPFDVFVNLIHENPDKVIICNIYDNKFIKCISTELNLISEDSVYSFLGGTLEYEFQKRPNDFLKYKLINWMRYHNKNFYILGGGLSNNDGIFKFKKSFFPNDVVPFYTGRKVINDEVYSYLTNMYYRKRKEKGCDEDLSNENNYFPLYRKPLKN